MWGDIHPASQSEHLQVETVATITFAREMGITHADFFRILPRVLDGYSYRTAGAVVTASQAQQRLILRLGPEGERRLARLRLPVTQVRFEFDGYTSEQAGALLDRFKRYFHRGGG